MILTPRPGTAGTYLVVVIEIDPAAQSLDSLPPFAGISHDHCSTLGIVLFYSQTRDGVSPGDAELLVDLEFDRDAVLQYRESAISSQGANNKPRCRLLCPNQSGGQRDGPS